MMMICFQGYMMLLIIFLAPAMASTDDFVSLAGYGEEKLSTVVVSGALLCHHRHRSPLPISGASVAVWCHKRKSNWVIRAKTDEYGDFVVDLPSHLHAIPNMEKSCRVRIVRVPKKSPCHLAPHKHRAAPIRLSSLANGIRSYTTHNIHLTPSHPFSTSHVLLNN